MAERHMPLERLAQAVRGDGFEVIIRPGAQGKSARNFAAVGYYMGCQAVVEHHTVSSGLVPINDVTYIESGKGVGYVIANAYTSLKGVIYLIASGPTYTEGSGGPWGIIPVNRGIDVCFSNEIASWGAHDSVYPDVQQDAALSLAYHAGRIAADVWDWPDDPFSQWRNFSHFEWTDASPVTAGRKVDPRGISRWSPLGGMWDMDAFRSDLHDYALPEEDEDMPARELIVKPPVATLFELKNGSRCEAPWFYVWNGDIRYALPTDVAAGVTTVNETALRYGLIYEQVYQRQVVLIA